jgi:hypothetical protein
MTQYDAEPQSEQWLTDRTTEAAPLPYAGKRSYTDEVERQVDLGAAEKGNIARAAGELGLTSTEWLDLRSQLGHSPSRSDVPKQ